MLTIQVLGGFKISSDGKPLHDLTKPRGQSLLTYLLLHCKTPQSRSHLAYTFWPDSSDKQARTNLRRELHQLRQGSPLIDNHLKSDTQTVQWIMPAAASVDATEFANSIIEAAQSDDAPQSKTYLQKAIDLYQGDLVPGLYDDWIVTKREELRQSFIQALESLTKLLIDEREYAPATKLTQRLLQADPLYEEGYAQLMELYALQNDRARVLHTYHTCVTVLERELGVPPSEEIEALYQRQLDAENGEKERRKPAVSTSSNLVGRKPEWQTLLTAWRHASKGQAHMVLIEGEAGIGKTRLAEELLEWVHRQAIPTARTRSYAAEGSLAYAPVIEWLRADALQAALNNLDDIWLTEITRLLPELLVEYPDLPPPQPMTEVHQRQRLFEAVARAFTVNSQPVLLLIDDLQWCDQETLEWLRFLLRFDPGAPFLVVGTARSEEVDAYHPLCTLSTELQIHSQFTQINLAPLSAEESTDLALQEYGTDLGTEAIEQIYRKSEGNPLFVVEMVRSGRYTESAINEINETNETNETDIIDLPPKVSAVIQHRLAQLSPMARLLVSLAATIGRAFSFEVLVAASEQSEDQVVNGLDELWRRRVIREGVVGSYDFSHDRIREAAYAALSPIRRKLLHRSVAETLCDIYDKQIEPFCAQVATHYEQAGLSEEAIAWYRRAATVANEIYAYRDAGTLLQEALNLLRVNYSHKQAPVKMGLLLRISNSFAITEGMASPAVGQISSQIEELLPEIQNVEQRLQALSCLRAYYAGSGNLERACQWAEDSLTLIPSMENSARQCEIYRICGFVNLQLGQLPRSYKYLKRAVGLISHGSDLWAHQAHTAIIPAHLALTYWLSGYPDQAHVRINETRSVAEKLKDPNATSIAKFWQSLVNSHLGQFETVLDLGESMIAIGTEFQIPISVNSGYDACGWALAAEGNFVEAIAHMRRGIDGMNEIKQTMFQTHRFGFLLDAQLKAGLLDDALETVHEAFEMSDRSGQRSWDAELYRLHGEILLAQGKPDAEVKACYQRALAIAEEQSAKMLSLRAAMSLCRLWARQGKIREAHQMLQGIYDWFTEGFDTPDLVEAKALLKQLLK